MLAGAREDLKIDRGYPGAVMNALRLSGSALAVLALAFGALGAVACFGLGPDQSVTWICLNPVTGKLDSATFDPNHVVNGMADPCHCYDPCGSQKTCPILVDAGAPGPGCPIVDAGSPAHGCDAGDGGS
jgi:hypothetical protein